jgi:hypothetical protein
MTELHTKLVLVALNFTAAQLDTDPTADVPDVVRRGMRAARLGDPDGAIFADAVARVQAETASDNRARAAYRALTATERERTHPRVVQTRTGRTGRVSNLSGWSASYVEVTWDDTRLWTPEAARTLRVLDAQATDAA